MKLSDAALVHPSADVRDATLGRYVEIGANCHVHHAVLGDYSYCVEGTQITYADIGKFANIAAHVRIYASRHPMDRASLHHFTYRSSWYFDDAEDNPDFFADRATRRITIGHDTWIGHGAVIMPGVAIGTGAVIGANAVVTRNVPDYAIAVGVPARVIRRRVPEEIAKRLLALAWWDWDHDRLRAALDDFRALPIPAFVDKHAS